MPITPQGGGMRSTQLHHRLVTHSLDQESGVPHRLCFVPGSVDIRAVAHGLVRIETEVPLTDRSVAGRFWRGHYELGPHSGQQVVVSTEEVAGLLDQGHAVAVIGGPYDTRQEAAYLADVAWEDPDD